VQTVIPVRTHFNIQDLWFDPADSGARKGDHVLVTTERGTEIGLVTMEPFEAPEEEVKGDLKHVMRVATEADLERAETLARRGEEAMPVFRQLVKDSGLDMKPVGVEFLFGGEKVVFYFAAEDRVDFRDLVRDLASHFRQRVDMRQIGVRDEARLVGGYAPCGQELCCVRFGGEFEPVSIRMAKEQDLPLNSSKISGVCGRLMCCLRYEFEAYRDFKQRAPKKNAVIDTPLGKAKIVEYNTPRETLTLRLENGKSFVIALANMTCSEGCCKRAAEQHTPLRPDTVTREALEELGTPDIVMQLAELDRANGEVGYVLDDSLLDVKRTPRRRNQEQPAAEKAGQPEGKRARAGKQADPAEGAEQARKPRRRSQGAEAAAGTDAQQPVRRSRRGRPLPPEPTPEQAAETAQQEAADTQRRQPRGGGMKPRRAGRGAAQQAEAPGQKAERAKPAGEANAAAQQAQQPARRTRRHHSAQAAGASAPAERTEQRAAQQDQDAQQPRQRRQRRQRPASQGEGDAGQQPKQEQQPRQERQRRQRRSAQEGGQQGVSAKQGGEGAAQQQQRPARRRRPGDRGGSAAPQAE